VILIGNKLLEFSFLAACVVQLFTSIIPSKGFIRMMTVEDFDVEDIKVGNCQPFVAFVPSNICTDPTIFHHIFSLNTWGGTHTTVFTSDQMERIMVTILCLRSVVCGHMGSIVLLNVSILSFILSRKRCLLK